MRPLLFLLACLAGRCAGDACGTSEHLQVRQKNYYGPLAVLTYDPSIRKGQGSSLSYELEFPASSGTYKLLLYSGGDYQKVNEYLTCQENEKPGSFSVELTDEGTSPPCQKVGGQNDTMLKCSGSYALPCSKCGSKPYPKWYVAISNCDTSVMLSNIDLTYTITTKGMLVCSTNSGHLVKASALGVVIAVAVFMRNIF